MRADLVLFNSRVTALDERRPEAAAVAVQDGRILAAGNDVKVMRHAGADARLIRSGLTGVMSCGCRTL